MSAQNTTEDLGTSASSQTRVVEAAARADETNAIDGLGLLLAVARRKRMIIGFVLICTFVAVTVSLLLPKEYTATTRILPPQQSQNSGMGMLAQLVGLNLPGLGGGAVGAKGQTDVYVSMLESRTVADALIRRNDLMRVYRERQMVDTRNELKKRTRIESEKGTISVRVEDRDPKRAADLANAYVEELMTLTRSLAVTEAGQRRLFYEGQLKNAKEDLAEAEIALRRTQERTGLLKLDEQARVIIESVSRMRAQLAIKEIELQGLRTSSTDSNPDVILLRQQIAGLREHLAKLEVSQDFGNGNVQIATRKVPEAGLEFVRALRDVKYREMLYEMLAKQYEAAKLDESKDAVVIQVMDKAIVPEKKSWPLRGLIVALVFIFSILAAIVAALIRQAFDNLGPERRRRWALLKAYLVGGV